MIPTFKLDSAQISAGIDELIRRTGKGALEVVLEEGKLLEVDLVRFTPPFADAPSTESFNAQRKAGEQAVERDIKRVFHVIDLSKIRRQSIRDRLETLVQQKDIEGIKAVLKDCRIPVQDVVREATEDLHNKFRDGRGRIRKNKWIWVLSERSVKRVLRAAKEKVGNAKAGWADAAAALGAKLPNWILRHGTSGGSSTLDVRDPRAPKITLRNNVPYIQTTGAELQVVDRALKNRARNIRVKLEKLIKSGWRKK